MVLLEIVKWQIVIILYWFVLFCKYDILLIPGPTLFNSSIVGNFRIKWRKVDWWISNVPPVCNRTRQFLFCPMRCPRFWDATANQHVRNLRISEFPRSHWSSVRHRYSGSPPHEGWTSLQCAMELNTTVDENWKTERTTFAFFS